MDNDDATLNDYKVREGGMLQVFHKTDEESDKPLQVTDADTDAAVREYRKIFINSDNGSPFTVSILLGIFFLRGFNIDYLFFFF